MISKREELTWARHDYSVTVAYSIGDPQRETFSVYNRVGVERQYAHSSVTGTQRGGLVSTVVGSGVFVSRDEARYYVKSLRDRIRANANGSAWKYTCTRYTYDSAGKLIETRTFE